MLLMSWQRKIFSRFFCLFLAGFLWLGISLKPVLAEDSEEQLFQVSQKAFEDGFYDVAVRYIEELLKEYPYTDKRIPAKILLGQCYFFKSQYLKAYDIFHELLDYNEFKDATLFWLAETYLKGSDYAQAERHYKQLIELYPDSTYAPQGYYSLGWLYYAQNKFDQAEETFQKFIQRFPDHQLSEDAAFKLGEADYSLKNYGEAVKQFQNFIERYSKSSHLAEAYFFLGESNYYQEDYLNAIAFYAKAADKAYDNKLILTAKISLGWSYLKVGKYDLAESSFDQAAQFSKEKEIPSEDILLGQATLYSETKDSAKALAAYNNLIAQFSNSARLPEAYLGRANIYYRLEEYPKAIVDYQFILDHFPSNQKIQEILEKTYFGLAWSYLKAGDIDRSIQTFQTVKDQTQNKTVKISALTQIGDAYQDAGEMEKALEVYDSILKTYPDSPYIDYVQYRQGITLLKMDKIEAATLSFQSLQANFPQSQYLNDIKYYLAITYFKKGSWTETVHQIEDFMKNLPKDHELLAQAHYILALSHFNLEQYEEAIKIFEKIIKDFPQEINLVRNSEINIAKGLYKSRKTKEAVKMFKDLVKKYPQSEIAQESLLWLGDHSLGSANFKEAVEY